jgi:hypothetical protein
MKPLPSIICGPILRRVEKSGVHIWIGLSQANISIQANVYQAGNLNTIIGSCEQKVLPFAKNLHVALLHIEPIAMEGFPEDEILCYDLLFDGKSIQELPIIEQLIYPPYTLPSFFIQSAETPLNLLFGSCRKIHGPGYDALSRGDDQIEDVATEIKQRPSALFLGGDQIYADEVSSVMIPIIMDLGKKLFGKKAASATSVNNAYRFGERGHLMEDSVGLRDLDYYSDNHLMKFQEYAAMYCLAWNPDIWPANWAEDALLDEARKVDFICQCEKATDKEVNKRWERHEKELPLVARFRKSLHKVRRLIANIPTYMIFDDHEISDDWNISYDWKTKMESHSAGTTILSNGLSAYWLFQAWGNAPDVFSYDFVSAMQTFIAASEENTQEKQLDHYRQLTNGFDNWDFIAPTHPNALFLDTRTQRKFEFFPDDAEEGLIDWQKIKKKVISKTNKAVNFLLRATNQILNEDTAEAIANSTPAQLIKGDYFEWMLEKHGSQLRNSSFLLVTATPVFGLQRLEDTVRYAGQLMDLHKFDNESWAANYNGYLKLLHFLMANLAPENCVILSGDVHYGFAIQNNLELPVNDKRLAKNLVQITSSSLKNNAKNEIDGIRKVLELFEVNTDEEKVNREVQWLEKRQYLQFKNDENEEVRIVSSNNLGKLHWGAGKLGFQFLFYQENDQQKAHSNELEIPTHIS